MPTSFQKRLPSLPIILISLFIAVMGIGCGGGGGGAPATYSVGGIVSGLINTGLVLQNNSGDDLSVSADGSFSFTTKLTTNSDYAVTVLTQPVDQTCSVTTGSAKVASSNITSVTVTCTADNQDAQGLYTTNGNGTGIFSGTAEALTDIKGMVYGDLPSQKFIFFDIATNVLYEGTITSITQTNFVGSAIVYHDGVMVDNAVPVSGTVITRSSITMALAANGSFEGGTIEGLFISPESIYDTAATNERIITRNIIFPWQDLTPGSVKMVSDNMFTSDFRVLGDDSYSFISDSSPGGVRCDFSGSLTSGSMKNIYVMSNEVVNLSPGPCSLSDTPNYTGFASVVTDDGTGKGTEMWYAITNGAHSVFAILTQQ